MAGSSSFTNNHLEKHDVFLSFRGEETRNGFTSHLYAALCRKQINTFIDDQIVRGDDISSFLLNTIKASKISVIIFSKNYASSKWCLQELEQILHCKKIEEQIVIPVFYHVDPSDVRNQIGKFGDGFAKLEKGTKEKLEMLQRWKIALNEAASLAGWTINGQKSESKLVDEISWAILKRLNKLSPSDYKGLVGVKFSINKIESLLHKGSNGVSKIGIWGIGGVGKTTITRVVFNKILHDFEGSYFAENIREESEKNSGLTDLREKLISIILEDKDPNIGLTFPRKRLEDKKVLIVFDDVTSLQQIENLIGNLNWLSSESQIIITTRDKQVLRNCGVDDAYIYKVKGLREKEAHILFNQYAFKQDCPIEDYMELSNKAISYTKCLPLALKVLGSYLFSHNKEFWESAINKLEKGPPLDIHKVLRVSYDGLDKEEKDLLLDIACFFKGEDIDPVIEALNACDISAKQGIQVLIDKCLVLVTYNNKITMHDLLQEVGKKIARDDACKDIRLWYHMDILKVFKNYKGSEAIRSINLDISKISNTGLIFHVLSKMDNLRFFRVYNSEHRFNYPFLSLYDGFNFPGEDDYGFEEPESFPNDITLFCWNNYPFKSLPLFFPSVSLVKLEMRHNKVKHWNGFQNVVNLKYVDLCFSQHMKEIPNLSRASNMQELILIGCTSLLEIAPSSIQNLNKLVNLDVGFCTRLISLPDYIQSKSITLSGCFNLKIAPKISCKVEKLKLTVTAIDELPFIEHPFILVELTLQNCPLLDSLSSSIFRLKSLKKLNLQSCSKLLSSSNGIVDLEALENLFLAATIMKENLVKLHNTSDCSSLQSISDPSFVLLPDWRSRGTTFANCFKLDLSKILHEPLDWHNKNFLGYFTSAVVCPEAIVFSIDPKEEEEFNILRDYSVTCYSLSEDGKKQIYKSCFGPWKDDYFVSSQFYSDHVLFNFYSITDNAFQKCDREYHEISCEMESLDCKVLIKFHSKDTKVKKSGINFLYVEDYGEPLETSRSSVDNAKKKGKEKEKDELQCSKLQISKSFDGISGLR
ncbi:disease resistance-like protein DSC1 [Pistacia vera]|uniref:disease resistance-like protein DSC1 n=1 Tax=Pistacia vera TaxID=55513 RepID=UPI001262CC5A|nr:disease resistance-like protein DSC1 [Pistacia vera]